MLRAAHIFAGAGGGILGGFLVGHIPVLAAELEPERCALLRHRYPGLAVAEGDIRGMDFTAWRGRVDVVCAGIPCPKWSTARHSVGEHDDLIPDFVRVVSEMQPRWVFVECVPGFAAERRRLAVSLSRIGITLSRPLILDAAAVGAPIARERYWALGRANEEGQPMLPVHAEVAELPAPDSSPWEVDPARLSVADGLADRWEMECAGDGQVPLQAGASPF